MARQVVPLSLVYTQIGLTVYGSFVIIAYGKQFVHYFNYWNRAIQSMDLNPTSKLYARGVKGNVYFFIFVTIVIVCFVFKLVPSLQDISGIVSQSIVHLYVRDIYRGNKAPLGVTQYFNESARCENRALGETPKSVNRTNVLNSPPLTYVGWKIIGFFISVCKSSNHNIYYYHNLMSLHCELDFELNVDLFYHLWPWFYASIQVFLQNVG